MVQPAEPTYEVSPDHSDWILDSGATNHVTSDINNLSSFFAYEGSDNLQIGNGKGLPISNIGSSLFTISTHSIKLTNILHVPHFSKNLISLSQLLLDNPHLIIEFTPSSCSLKDPLMRTSHQVTCANGLFLLSLKRIHPPQAYFGIRTSADQWHARFGHPSTSTTLHLLFSNKLPCSSKTLSPCTNCFMAKSHKLPFSFSLSSSTFPLELIHSDVWGPSPITSFHGFRYYVTFIDDFSKFIWVYFLKHKSEVTHIFSCFKAQIENILGTTIKTLRTDGGTEYLPIQRHFPQIIHQTSCPYTPQQNGVAERKHRHLVELSLASMSHASIPTDYWDDIFSSVAFLINRLPSTSHQTPFTTLFKKDPDYASLRILGCLCFPHTRPYNTHKLQLRALPCVFLGYASHQKGYRCLHIPTKKIYISRHVQFVENIFPFSEPSIPNPTPVIPSASSSLIPLLGFLPPDPSAVARPAPAPASPQLLGYSSAKARPAPAPASPLLLGFPPPGSDSAAARPATYSSW